MTKKVFAILVLLPFSAPSQSINKDEWRGKIKSVTKWYSYSNYAVSSLNECIEEADYVIEYHLNKQGTFTHIISPSFSAFKNYLDTFYYDKNGQMIKAEHYRQYTDAIRYLDSYTIFSFDSALKRNFIKKYEGSDNLTSERIYDNENKFLEKREWNYKAKKFDTTFTNDDENNYNVDTTCFDESYNNHGDVVERYNLKAVYDTLRKIKPGSPLKKRVKQVQAYDSLGNEIKLLLLPKGTKIIKYTYTYEYDIYQNWVKQFCYKEGKLYVINYRRIEYY